LRLDRTGISNTGSMNLRAKGDRGGGLRKETYYSQKPSARSLPRQ
jgi:hypothetical protein